MPVSSPESSSTVGYSRRFSFEQVFIYFIPMEIKIRSHCSVHLLPDYEKNNNKNPNYLHLIFEMRKKPSEMIVKIIPEW